MLIPVNRNGSCADNSIAEDGHVLLVILRTDELRRKQVRRALAAMARKQKRFPPEEVAAGNSTLGTGKESSSLIWARGGGNLALSPFPALAQRRGHFCSYLRGINSTTRSTTALVAAGS